MDSVFKSGLMGHVMKDSGGLIKRAVAANSGTSTATSSKENGSRTKQTATASTLT